jgi:hypothetical protein
MRSFPRGLTGGWIRVAAFVAALATRGEASGQVPPAADHRTEPAQTQGANSRRISSEGSKPASADAPLISFIDSPGATCYKPDPRQDLCFVTWSYNSVTASTSQYLIAMPIFLDGRLVAYPSGFFQTSMYLPGDFFGPGFRVSCGQPVSVPAPWDSSGTTTYTKGNDHSYTIRATETGGLSSANYGSVSCPAYFSAEGGAIVSIFPTSFSRTQPPDTTFDTTLALQNTAAFPLLWDLPVSRFSGCGVGSVPWLSLGETTGVTPGLGRETIPVTFDSASLAPGTYSAHVCVSSSDRFSPRLDVPVTLTVPCLAGPPVLSGASLRVDEHASIGSSNLNGVLDPGETDFVDPAWQNTGCSAGTLTGTATNFGGPSGPTYIRYDAAADYGTVPSVGGSSCLDATGNCYQVRVSSPASRPATHWDALLTEQPSVGLAKVWKLHVGRSFTDVPVSQPFYRKIETLFHNGITAGCTATEYCPGSVVSRSQMAIFIARGIAGSGGAVPVSGTVGANAYNCISGGVSLFTDVQPTDIFCRHVHYIAAQNVTLGCAPSLFCPSGNVSRLAMAGFMAKALVAPSGGPGVPSSYPPDPVTGLSYSCESASPSVHFSDVPASDSFCKHVHFLWARGIISGCSSTQYCPGASVTRDAMAKFLSNAFELQLYGP